MNRYKIHFLLSINSIKIGMHTYSENIHICCLKNPKTNKGVNKQNQSITNLFSIVSLKNFSMSSALRAIRDQRGSPVRQKSETEVEVPNTVKTVRAHRMKNKKTIHSRKTSDVLL